MVKITNGTNVFEVTTGAYESIYKRQGYVPLDEKPASPAPPEGADVNSVQDADFQLVNQLLEKPIAQWTKTEVKEFARIEGIDLAGTKNANEAKELIKEYLDSNAEDAE